MVKLKISICLTILLCLAAAAGAVDAQKMMSVQVREGQIRATPSFLGRIAGNVFYGDRVVLEGVKGAWSQIRKPDSDVAGWIHTSALTQKKIVLKAGASDVEQTATTREIALAGKGFNEQVEREYKTKNPEADFTWIDKMEQIVVSQKEMRKFLEDGGLFPEGGY